MTETTSSLLCIELDCLLDTRLATLYQIDPEAVKAVLDHGYLDRWTDDFPVDRALFQTVYRARDRLILKNSVMTPMVRLCREFVQATLQQNLNSPYQYTPKIAVNIHPYDLEEAECEVFIRAIATAIHQPCDIQIIRYDYTQLTPTWLKQECSILVLYDYTAWLEYHSVHGEWKTVTCPEVTLMGPALYFKGPPSPTAMAEAHAMHITPFEAMEQLAGPLIQLTLLPVRYFSIALESAPSAETTVSPAAS